MKTNSKRTLTLGSILAVVSMMTSCVFDFAYSIPFVNRTNDTLIIGWSVQNNIDSIYLFLDGMTCKNSGLSDTISLGGRIAEYDMIPPDSMCFMGPSYPPKRQDPIYLFIIKSDDMREYSWNEIRDKQLYRRKRIVFDKDGNYDKELHY